MTVLNQSDRATGTTVAGGAGRCASYDWIRVLACVFVCIEHSLSISRLEGMHPLINLILYYTTESAIPLFFMISGALLLPVTEPAGNFLRKRFWAVGVPFMVWSILYLCRDILVYPPYWKIELVSLPLMPVANSAFWFLYTIMGLYLVSPVISPWLRSCSRRQLRFYMCLWLFTSCYIYIGRFIDGFRFPDVRNPFFYFMGYIGFYVLGFYIRRFVDVSSRRFICKLSCLILFGVVLPPVAEQICGLGYIGEWDLGFPAVCMGLAVYLVVTRLTYQSLSPRWLVCLSSMSFGVYLVNAFVLSLLDMTGWQYVMGAGEQTFLFSLICILGSYMFIYAVSWLPGAKYIVGAVRLPHRAR